MGSSVPVCLKSWLLFSGIDFEGVKHKILQRSKNDHSCTIWLNSLNQQNSKDGKNIFCSVNFTCVKKQAFSVVLGAR